MSASNWVHLDVDEILRETPAAFMVLIDDEQIWLPKSQIADADDYEEGDVDLVISITEWIANEKGLS